MKTITTVLHLIIGCVLGSSIVVVVQAAPQAIRAEAAVPCKVFASGHLAVRPYSNVLYGDGTFAGITPGANKTGIDGKPYSWLVTADSKGNALSPQVWEVAVCPSKKKYPVFPTKLALPPNVKPLNYTYGIIRPQNSTKHSLSVTSKDFTDQGERFSLVDSLISTTPEGYRTFLAISYRLSKNTLGYLLYVAGTNTTSRIVKDKFKHVQFISGASLPIADPVQLVLLPLSDIDAYAVAADE